MLAFEDKVKENKAAFLAGVVRIAKLLQADPNWLMGTMNAESGLNSRAVNPTTQATGLIQFMPATALGLGTSVQALKQMSNVDQLEYVYEYFKQYTGKLKTYFDTYIAVFFPRAIGKPDQWVFETKNISASKIAQQNPAIDIDKNREITVGEFKLYLYNTIPALLRNLFFTVTKNPALVLCVGVAFYYLIKK